MASQLLTVVAQRLTHDSIVHRRKMTPDIHTMTKPLLRTIPLHLRLAAVILNENSVAERHTHISVPGISAGKDVSIRC